MFRWIERRSKLRREDDLRLKMEEAIAKKKAEAEETIKKMKRFTLDPDRRFHALPVIIDRRQERTA